MIASLVVLSALSIVLNSGLIVWASRLERERGFALANERAAYERLIQARKDGYDVPDAPLPAVAIEPEPPLIPELQSLVDEWDSDIAKMAQMGVIKRMISSGKSQAEVAIALQPKDLSVEPEVNIG